ncbi:MAG TPA: Xaa-Pro peptidase family protein [Thermoanaerobaculia bacterium]|jgi:Xaa-Pro aminopeptidase|nr:Xaa-Pro peptidase family protein [Thermoanaerobaculia bacterium]
MLADLDSLLRERGLGALIVPMHEAMHPAFRWLTRGAKVTRGYAVKLADAEPVLVTYPMERAEAAATGLTVRLAAEFDSERIFRTATSGAAAYGEFFDLLLRELGARESVAFFGNAPLHLYLGISAEMERRGWRVQRGGEDLVQRARKRKEAFEIEAIRSVGKRTEEVVDLVRTALRERQARKLGDLKELVSFEIARRGMFEDHETILSHGRDAGIPHSRGNASDVIREGVPIVLDIFPADRASGYFFDLTRTFCVGAAPAELRQLHAHVLEAFLLARDAMRPGTPAATYQHLVCDFFERRGYPTIRSHPATDEGYVHGLGHGVGLEIHEKPSFSILPSNADRIETGDIITIEPGLYFPERELGVRIEDTFVVAAGGVETLCRGSYGLEP